MNAVADRIHCIRKTLRLTPQEAKLLGEKSENAGMNEAEYLRLLISQKPNDYPEIRELIKSLINEVNLIERRLRDWHQADNPYSDSQQTRERIFFYTVRHLFRV